MVHRRRALVLIAVLGLFVAAVAWISPKRQASRRLHRQPTPLAVGEEKTVVLPVAKETRIVSEDPEPRGEIAELLEVEEGTAVTIEEMLRERDQAAEALLADELTTGVIHSVQPALLALERRTDAAVQALLPSLKREEYQRLRAEGIIPGVALEVPPSGRPEPDVD